VKVLGAARLIWGQARLPVLIQPAPSIHMRRRMEEYSRGSNQFLGHGSSDEPWRSARSRSEVADRSVVLQEARPRASSRHGTIVPNARYP
jgi:hypothetical protein